MDTFVYDPVCVQLEARTSSAPDPPMKYPVPVVPVTDTMVPAEAKPANSKPITQAKEERMRKIYHGVSFESR
jgi:hypothetical protein